MQPTIYKKINNLLLMNLNKNKKKLHVIFGRELQVLMNLVDSILVFLVIYLTKVFLVEKN